MFSTKHALSFLVAATVPATLVPAAVQLTGVNLSGGEFGTSTGTYGQDYIYPSTKEINYYVGKGMNVFRIPFQWERLQTTLGGALNTAELQRIKNVVNAATAAGASVILDPHDYGRYNGAVIGATGGVTNAQFADLWSRLGTTFKGNDKVIFGLMNEPHGMPSTESWVTSSNAAISAIRTAGATNMILVPGVNWTGAYSWTSTSYGTPNSVAMLKITDPANNFAFDVHQYLDSDSSGTHESVVNSNIGVQRLQAFTAWAEANNERGFLGEFAVPNSTIGTGASQIGDEAVTKMLDYMDANSKAWLGWTWWAGGPWWGDYMFTMEPTNLGLANQADQPSMDLVEGRLAGVPEPAGPMLLSATAALMMRRVRRVNQRL